MTVLQPLPWFVTPPSDAARRLLLLTYHFPPGQEAGALRWQKLARYAVELGWSLDVVALDPADLIRPDRSRLRELPAGIRLFGVRRPRLVIERLEYVAWRLYRRLCPRRAAAAAPIAVGSATAAAPGSYGRDEIRWRLHHPGDWRRAYYAVVEFTREYGWASAAANLALRLAATTAYDAIMTCGPPHMVHEAGRRVAAMSGIPFVMDLRDPWSLVERVADVFASPIWFRLADRYERRAVARAGLVVMNTEPARRAMQATYPEAAGRILAVPNGCDEDDPVPSGRDDSRFLVGFAGSISLDRDPRPIIRAAARVIKELSLATDKFRVEFMGDLCGGVGVEALSIPSLAREAGIEPFVGAIDFRPRQEVVSFLARATVLVSLYQDSRLAVPSKIFEYMQYDAWLLVLAEPDSATGMLLHATDADVVVPGDETALAAALRQRYEQFVRGVRPVRLAIDPRFGRRHQAGILFQALERLTGTPASGKAAATGPGKETGST